MDAFTLEPLPGYTPFDGPVVCAVLDGVGLGKGDESDGVFLARTPVLDALLNTPLYRELKAHGTAVGMPSDADMGNSEVGHNTLGAGRVYAQGAKRVHDAVASGVLFQGKTWKAAVDRAHAGGTLHFIGLLSDGNVHSHIDHLFAMLERCRDEGVPRVRVHVLLDGRDVGEKSALRYLGPTEAKLAALSTDGRDYRIASGGGRMVTTMDRYNADWSIVERGWKAHVLGEGPSFTSATEAVSTNYAEDPAMTDQYLDPFVIADDGAPIGTIENEDAVVCFNFRGDRAIELSIAFEADDFAYFDRVRVPKVFYAGMMQYDGDAAIPKHFLVEPTAVDGVLGQYLCGMGVRSYAISETQKFGHVTYFWNGNNTGYLDADLEKYVEIPSDRVPFDQAPAMKASEITDATIAAMESGGFKFLRLNYPNGDMVGHCGVPEATIAAVEAVDVGVGRLLDAAQRTGGVVVLLADHGNADLMFTEKNGKREAHVAHTLNPVPCIIQDYSGANRFRIRTPAEMTVPGLSNIAATLCNLLGYEAPPEYDASLVVLEA